MGRRNIYTFIMKLSVTHEFGSFLGIRSKGTREGELQELLRN